MCFFKVNINRSNKDLLLQYLSTLKTVHIKSRPKTSQKLEKEDFIENIKRLRSGLEELFKDLKITEYDLQKLNIDKSKRKEFVVKDIYELVSNALEDIDFYTNRIGELKKYISNVEIEFNKMKLINECYRFLEKFNLTRDDSSHFNRLAFKVYTTFSKNLFNIENLFEFSHFPNFHQIENISEDRIVFFIIYPKEKEEDLEERIKVTHAEVVPILKKYLIPNGINFTRINNEINLITDTLSKYQKELERLREENLLLFAALYEIVQNLEEYNWADQQFEELSSNRFELQFFVPLAKKQEVQQGLIKNFKDQITIESLDITRFNPVKFEDNVPHLYLAKAADSKNTEYVEEKPSNVDKKEEDLRNSTPTIMRNNFFVRPFETLTRMYGIPAYSEIDPTPFLAFTFPLLFGIMFGDIGHGFVLIFSGLIGALVFRKKKSRDFLNFCWIIFYCGWGAILMGYLYGEFFGMNEINLFGMIIIPLEPFTIPFLNITLHNPLDNILMIFMFAVLIGVIHINLGWFIQFLNYWKQSRKYLAVTDSLIKILLLTGGAILIFTYKFDIGSWISPPYPILLPLIPGLLLIILKPLGKIFGLSYMKKETYGGLLGEGSMETFETLLSIISNVSSYIRLLALALAHISLMIAIQAIIGINKGTGILFEILRITGLIFGNLVVILLEGLLVFINALRLHFYEFFFKFYQGSGTQFFPFFLDTNYSIIIFKEIAGKDIISEEIEKTIELKSSQEEINKALEYISKKYL